VQTRLPPWRNTGKVLLSCVAIFGVATVGFGLSRWMPLSLLCLFMLGGFDNVSAVIRSTLEQVVSPDALRGRIAAIHWVFIGLSNEMGEFESGVAASLLGTVPAVVFGGAGTIAVVLAVELEDARGRAGYLAGLTLSFNRVDSMQLFRSPRFLAFCSGLAVLLAHGWQRLASGRF